MSPKIRPLLIGLLAITIIGCRRNNPRGRLELSPGTAEGGKVLKGYISNFFAGKDTQLGQKKQKILQKVLEGQGDTPKQRQANVIKAFEKFEYSSPTLPECTIKGVWSRSVALDRLKDFLEGTENLAVLLGEPMKYDMHSEEACDTVHYVSDFANKFIGGGCLGDGSGWAQEEQQFIETGLVFFAECLHSQSRVLLGSHSVMLLHHVPRFADISVKQQYEKNLTPTKDSDKIIASIQPLTSPTKHNILVIDAPDLRNRSGEYTSEELNHLFRKLYIGYHAVVKANVGKKVIVATGNFGTGAFCNNAVIMYCFNLLAAFLVNVEYEEFPLSIVVYPFNKAGERAYNLARALVLTVIQREDVQAKPCLTAIWTAFKEEAAKKKVSLFIGKYKA